MFPQAGSAHRRTFRRIGLGALVIAEEVKRIRHTEGRERGRRLRFEPTPDVEGAWHPIRRVEASMAGLGGRASASTARTSST